jgi:hypothetical protein
MPRRNQSPTRLAALLFVPFLILGISIPVFEEQVNRGIATPAAFGLLVAIFALSFTPLGDALEELVFHTERRPWLGGRLKPWQRLILPFSTARVLTLGFSWSFGGGAYLIDAPPGGTMPNILAVLFCATGGALLGFGLSRLWVGFFVIRWSGLWAAPRVVWLAGAIVVSIGSVAGCVHSVMTAMQYSSVI